MVSSMGVFRSAREIMEAHLVARQNNLIGPTMEQPQYNMLHRYRVELEYSQIYKTIGLGTTIWSPLASGVLTTKYLDQFPADTRFGMKSLDWLKNQALTPERLDKSRELNKLAQELGTSLPKMGVAWCLLNPNVSTVILGASKVQQLEETLTAMDVLPLLTPEVQARIEGILQNKPKLTVF